MNSKLMATFAIVVGLAAVGAVAAGTVMVAQQAFADSHDDHPGHHGCAKHSTGFENSGGQCRHRNRD